MSRNMVPALHLSCCLHCNVSESQEGHWQARFAPNALSMPDRYNKCVQTGIHQIIRQPLG